MSPNDDARMFRVVDPDRARTASPVDPVADAIAGRIRFALGEIEQVHAGADSGRQAAALLEEMARLTEADAGAFEGRKRELWAAVANGRAAIRREQTAAGEPVAVSPRLVAQVGALTAGVASAQQKANRKLASPSAYRKLIEAKNALSAALGAAGYDDVDELRAAQETALVVEPPADRLRSLRADLAAAEAAWETFEAQDPSALPPGTEGDALRARAYRVLGEVVDDAVLRDRLVDLEAQGRRGADAFAVLRSALRDAGFEPGGDAVALGQLYLRVP